MGATSANLDYKDDADSDPSHEPLLGKRHPNEQDDQTEVTSISITPLEVDSSVFTFNAGWRSYQDTTFTVLFIVTMIFTYGFGIFATMNANVHGFAGARNAYYHPSSHQCNLPDPAVMGGISEHFGGTSHEILNLALLSGPMLGTLISCFPLGIMMQWLLHRYTKVLVYITLPFAFLLPFAINIAWFSYCQSSGERCTTMSYSTQTTLFIIINVVCCPLSFSSVLEACPHPTHNSDPEHGHASPQAEHVTHGGATSIGSWGASRQWPGWHVYLLCVFEWEGCSR